VNFAAPSSLTVGGELAIQDGARLRLDGSNPARDLTLDTGSSYTGDGTVQFEGSNRLVMTGNAGLTGGTWDFQGSSSIAGSGLLTVGTNALLHFDHSVTMPGSLTVAGTLTLANAAVTLQVNGSLTLAATGAINNPGTVRAGAFVNQGGTITGNAPVVSGGLGTQSLRINRITVARGQGIGSGQAGLATQGQVIISWSSAPGLRFVVESGVNCVSWRPESAVILETVPGEYQGTITTARDPCRYFRLRWTVMQE
jgi:hypothetical protein